MRHLFLKGYHRGESDKGGAHMTTLTVNGGIATRTIEGHKESKAGSSRRVVDTLWGLAFSLGFAPRHRLEFLDSHRLSDKEKDELKAYLMGF
jgi:hypothetical protein